MVYLIRIYRSPHCCQNPSKLIKVWLNGIKIQSALVIVSHILSACIHPRQRFESVYKNDSNNQENDVTYLFVYPRVLCYDE